MGEEKRDSLCVPRVDRTTKTRRVSEVRLSVAYPLERTKVGLLQRGLGVLKVP